MLPESLCLNARQRVRAAYPHVLRPIARNNNISKCSRSWVKIVATLDCAPTPNVSMSIMHAAAPKTLYRRPIFNAGLCPTRCLTAHPARWAFSISTRTGRSERPRVAFALSEPASPRVLSADDEVPPTQSVIPPHTPRLTCCQSKATTPQIRAWGRPRRFASFKQFFHREVADVVGAR
jgi:hypothetical protein